MADHKRGRALKQLQLLPRENKEGAEKRPIQKEPGRRKREGSTATGSVHQAGINRYDLLLSRFFLP